MAKLPRGPSQPSLPTPAPPALGRGCLLSPHPCPALVPSPGFRCHWGSVPRGRGPLPRPRTPLKLAGAQALLAMLSKPRRCDAEGPRFRSCPLELPPCAGHGGPGARPCPRLQEPRDLPDRMRRPLARRAGHAATLGKAAQRRRTLCNFGFIPGWRRLRVAAARRPCEKPPPAPGAGPGGRRFTVHGSERPRTPRLWPLGTRPVSFIKEGAHDPGAPATAGPAAAAPPARMRASFPARPPARRGVARRRGAALEKGAWQLSGR